jgi:hypothetical protein
MLPLQLWREWQATRRDRRRASTYVISLLEEPLEADASWLAEHATGGDDDHARWELRYARRAIGLIVAQRDALDDETASLVARELASTLDRDRNVDSAKMRIAEQQLNARIKGYSAAYAERVPGIPLAERLGHTLLDFSGVRGMPAKDISAGAAEITSRYLAETGDALRSAFGVAALPEDIAPSAIIQGGKSR